MAILSVCLLHTIVGEINHALLTLTFVDGRYYNYIQNKIKKRNGCVVEETQLSRSSNIVISSEAE